MTITVWLHNTNSLLPLDLVDWLESTYFTMRDYP
jgi:hypothetical protein